MGTLSIIIAILVAVILIIAAIIAVYTSGDDKEFVCGITIDKSEDNVQYEPNVPDNGPNTPNSGKVKHTVFIEEGTATWCVNCPNAAKAIQELYESGDYNFYYVTMIDDKNDVAQKRLKEGYNIEAYPTLFIDGGYKVIPGEDKSEFIGGIRDAESRDVPDIEVSVSVSYDNDTDELETSVLIENHENYTYDGTLRVYLTEKVSRWVNRFTTYDGELVPHHFGFLDFVINQEIGIGGNSNDTFKDKRKLSEFSVSDIAPDEIVVFAVVFNSHSVEKDSYPPTKRTGKFDAHYADAASSAELVEGGNSPPIVGVDSPEFERVNLFGKPLFHTYFGSTYLIGKTTIKATAEDDKEVVKVEFYIDDKLVYEDNEAPYEYSFKKIDMFKHLFRKHTIKIVAYDEEGRTSSTYFDAFTVLL